MAVAGAEDLPTDRARREVPVEEVVRRVPDCDIAVGASVRKELRAGRGEMRCLEGGLWLGLDPAMGCLEVLRAELLPQVYGFVKVF